MPTVIDTDRFSIEMRARSVDCEGQSLLIANLGGSEQEKDLSEPLNCLGLGRIRHFRRATSSGWPSNPLPIEPASKIIGCQTTDEVRAQVFQNAACNWRCWYCYVPFSLLGADQKSGSWLRASDLVDLYLEQADPPQIIDLSGGQPDLVPEWIVWMMQELLNRNMSRSVFLWSDDNLSNEFFWRHLSDKQREVVASYPAYGKVCCFKGFDEHSFAFNTAAAAELFWRQLALMRRHLQTGIDIYAYATFTTPTLTGVRDSMRRFMDSLQGIHADLPLRVVPLEIQQFSPLNSRMTDLHRSALENQNVVVQYWQKELEDRFSAAQRNSPITAVELTIR